MHEGETFDGLVGIPIAAGDFIGAGRVGTPRQHAARRDRAGKNISRVKVHPKLGTRTRVGPDERVNILGKISARCRVDGARIERDGGTNSRDGDSFEDRKGN